MNGTALGDLLGVAVGIIVGVNDGDDVDTTVTLRTRLFEVSAMYTLPGVTKSAE